MPRSDAKRRVADLVAQVEFGEHLVAGESAAGDGGPHHEAVELGLGRAVYPGLGPAFAVVLLIRAVMFDDLSGDFADEVVAVAQFFRDRAAKIVARGFGDFHGTRFFSVTVLRRIRLSCIFTKSLNITHFVTIINDSVNWVRSQDWS